MILFEQLLEYREASSPSPPHGMAPVDRKSQLALQEDIIRLGEAAYDPALSDESRNAGITEFKSFLERFVSSFFHLQVL